MSFELYVGNYPFSFAEEDIKKLFKAYKGLKFVKMFQKNPKSFSFFTCSDMDELVAVIREMHNRDVSSRRLVVRARDRSLQEYVDLLLQEDKNDVNSDSLNQSFKENRATEIRTPLKTPEDPFVKEEAPSQSTIRKKFSRGATHANNPRQPRKVSCTSPIPSPVSPSNCVSECYAAKGCNSELDSSSSPGSSRNSIIQYDLDSLTWLSVTNFPYGTNVQSIYKFFAAYNPIQVFMDCNYDRGDGYLTETFVGFENRDVANDVIMSFDNTLFEDRVIHVKGEVTSQSNTRENFSRGATYANNPKQPRKLSCSSPVPSSESSSNHVIKCYAAEGCNRELDSSSPENSRNSIRYDLDSSTWVSVTNFPYGTNVGSIYKLFAAYNPINVFMDCNYDSGYGYLTEAFVEFENRDVADDVIMSFDNTFFGGRVIHVKVEASSQSNTRKNFSRGATYANNSRQPRKLSCGSPVPSSESPSNRNHVSECYAAEGCNRELDSSSPENSRNSIIRYDLDSLTWLSVTNFPYGTNVASIYELFAAYNPIRVFMDCNYDRGDGYLTEAFVGFENRDVADDVIMSFDNTLFRRRVILVNDINDVTPLDELLDICHS